jgi:tripartite-type tricarboxylate transporter receptor subunit TctC
MSCLTKTFPSLAIALASALVLPAAHAQDFPNRPVKIIATFTAGGAADATARIFAEKLSTLWKQPVYVDNRVGGGGSIGADTVFRSPADGYTLLLATNTHVINHVLLKNLGYDYTKDFAPLGLVTSTATMLAVTPNIKANNLKEVTEMLKASPGKYQYSACNMASPQHFSMEMYKHALNLEAQNIPYRGCTPAITDALGGQINIVMASVTAMSAFVKQGTLKPIAVMSSKRSPTLPDVPTARESGIPELKNFSLDNYYGFMAPRGTPPAVLKKIEADVLAVAKTFSEPEMKARIEAAGLEPFVMNSTDMMKLIRSDAGKLATAAKQANIQAE